MRAYVVSAPQHAEVRDWADPTPGGDEVLVAPVLIGVCGTDLELIDGTIDPAYVRYPLALGHEWIGRLEQAVEGIGEVGTPAVVEGLIPCGVCEVCIRGATNLCAVYDEVGFTRPGAIAEHISVPKSLVHRIGDDVAFDDAVLIEPMAVVWRALSRLPIGRGLGIAVIGDGTIAMLAVHLVRLFDPARTIVFGRSKQQRDLALRAGASDFTISTPAQRFDLVIEASGSIDGVETALGSCARGGMVILLGLPPHGATVEVVPDELVNDDVIIQGSFSYTREAFSEVVRRVNNHDLQPSFLITHRFGLEDAGSAIAALRGGSTGPRGKVVIDIARTLTTQSAWTGP